MTATSLDFTVPSLPGRGIDVGYARIAPGPDRQVGGGGAGVRHVDAALLPAPRAPVGKWGAQFGCALVLAIAVVAVFEMVRRLRTARPRHASRDDLADPHPRTPATEEAIRQAFLARYGKTPT